MVLNFTFTPTPSFKYGSNIQSRACCSIRDLTSGVGALSATTVLTVPFLAISSANLIAYAPSAFLSIRIRSILQTMQRGPWTETEAPKSHCGWQEILARPRFDHGLQASTLEPVPHIT